MAKIHPHILAILDRSTFNGDAMKLPAEQLPRDTYLAVAKVIEAAGGKWSRKRASHIFEGDAAETMEPIIMTGEITNKKQELGAFDTPAKLARQIVAMANIEIGMQVLEPNIGIGRLAIEAMFEGGIVTGMEIDEKRRARAKQNCPEATIFDGDFLAMVPAMNAKFDRVVMNPPFAGQVDIDHVMHAVRFLRPGGRLVAIMSAGVKFRSNRKTVAFRDFLSEAMGIITDLPDNSFSESGTGVNAVIVAFNV